jgi:hypothetical protein
MFTGASQIALFTEAARTRPHAPSFVITIEKNLNFKTKHDLIQNLASLPLF